MWLSVADRCVAVLSVTDRCVVVLSVADRCVVVCAGRGSRGRGGRIPSQV